MLSTLNPFILKTKILHKHSTIALMIVLKHFYCFFLASLSYNINIVTCSYVDQVVPYSDRLDYIQSKLGLRPKTKVTRRILFWPMCFAAATKYRAKYRPVFF